MGLSLRALLCRTGGTDGAQTVYYCTVNGSAVGGTHFTHIANSIDFAAGESSKTISVTELGVTKTYGGKAATAYSNDDRTYTHAVNYTGISGHFDNSTLSLESVVGTPVNEAPTKSATLTLSGVLDKAANNSTVGTVTVTLCD